MIANDLLASGYFLSVSSTISSTALIVYRIYNSVSNQDSRSKKRFMHIVDVLVQSAALYALALLVTAITGVVEIISGDATTVSLYAVINYEGVAIFVFASVRTTGVQMLGKV